MSYSTEVLADSPQVYWRMNDASGTVATDSSGNGNDGTYSGGPTLGTTGLLVGDSDKAITLTGANLVFRAAGSAAPFTAEALIKPSSVSGTQVIMSMQDAINAAWTFRLEGTTLKFYYWNGSGTLQTAISGSTVFATGTVYHVAVSFTASGNVFLYVNGSQVGTAATTTLAGTSLNFRVGASGGGEFYSGVSDEVAYYTTALSGARIAAHYTAATSSSTNATVTAVAATGTATAVVPAASASSAVTPSAATASASARTPAVSATGSATVSAVAATATATAIAPTATADATIASVVATSASTAVTPTVAATADATVVAVPATATAATVIPTVNNGSGSANVFAVPATAATVALVPTFTQIIVAGTDTSNFLNGRNRRGRATSTVDRPVGTTPSRAAVKYDKAVPYPPPTLVDGRVT